jgi:hypothetical protein
MSPCLRPNDTVGSARATAARSPRLTDTCLMAAPFVSAALRRDGHDVAVAIYLASSDSYQDSVVPTGYPVGTSQEALDCACGLDLNDSTAWRQPRRTSSPDH